MRKMTVLKVLANFIILVCAFLAIDASASIRPIVIPGRTAIIMMQAAGLGDMDPDPRSLYDAIALPEVSDPSGGTGKVIRTDDRAFSLSCAFKSVVSPLNVNCTINIQPASGTTIASGLVEARVTGAEAEELYEQFAGPQASAPFVWSSSNQWLHFESTREAFYFRFKATP